MSLGPGVRLGPYEVIAAIGAGGMGEVYRARDTKLNRDVALKILPATFASDPDRLARFHREAQVLASLNHPHIAAIYGFEDSGDTHALVLELVEGPTLADRIALGPLPVDEAIAIAAQLAEALEAAHEQGIIHRDLKPANIKLKADGTVKVLDFGLAKLAEPAGVGQLAAGSVLSMSPTITSPAMMTGVGVILGTAAYMSPEQAKGRVADKRSDIWAFGCVLYQMLTGQRPFGGDDVTETIAAVVRADPDWTALPAATAPSLRRLLSRCLEKDARQRLRDIGDARLELVDSALTANPVVAVTPHVYASRGVRIVAGAAFVSVVALAFTAGYAVRSSDKPGTSIQFSFPLPAGHALISGPIIARDGGRIAYVSSDGATPQRLYVKEPNEFEARVIPGTEGAAEPFFSPDGRWIAFFAKGRLFKVDLQGGAPVAIGDAPSPLGGTWREDDTLVFTPTWNGGLYRMNANGGQPEPLIRPDKKTEYAYTWPYFLPGGRELIFTTWGTSFTISRLTLTGLDRTIIERVETGAANSAAYAGSGHLLLGNNGQLQAVPYAQGTSTGRVAPATVVDHVQWPGLPASGESAFSVSVTGTLVYAPADITQRSLVFVDQTGRATPAASERHAYSRISLSRCTA